MTNETKWSIDPTHSDISFSVRHLMISHIKGNFQTYDANIYTTNKDFTTANIDVWIDAASVTTSDAKRDEHLKSAEFFDVKNHRQITFTASNIGKFLHDGKHEMWGELTMKGVTKLIKLEVKFGGIVNDPWGNEKAGFTITGQINRNDWGLNWNTAIETGGLLVGEEVTISCEIELTKVSHKDMKMELILETAATN